MRVLSAQSLLLFAPPRGPEQRQCHHPQINIFKLLKFISGFQIQVLKPDRSA